METYLIKKKLYKRPLIISRCSLLHAIHIFPAVWMLMNSLLVEIYRLGHQPIVHEVLIILIFVESYYFKWIFQGHKQKIVTGWHIWSVLRGSQSKCYTFSFVRTSMCSLALSSRQRTSLMFEDFQSYYPRLERFDKYCDFLAQLNTWVQDRVSSPWSTNFSGQSQPCQVIILLFHINKVWE